MNGYLDRTASYSNFMDPAMLDSSASIGSTLISATPPNRHRRLSINTATTRLVNGITMTPSPPPAMRPTPPPGRGSNPRISPPTIVTTAVPPPVAQLPMPDEELRAMHQEVQRLDSNAMKSQIDEEYTDAIVHFTSGLLLKRRLFEHYAKVGSEFTWAAQRRVADTLHRLGVVKRLDGHPNGARGDFEACLLLKRQLFPQIGEEEDIEVQKTMKALARLERRGSRIGNVRAPTHLPTRPLTRARLRCSLYSISVTQITIHTHTHTHTRTYFPQPSAST